MKTIAVAVGACLCAFSGSATLAADLLDAYPTVDYAPIGSPFSGGYAGGNFGYSSGVDSAANHNDFTIAGVNAGGQAGYNFALRGGFVVGGQADFNLSTASGSDGIAVAGKINWTGSVTGHVGYAINDIFMPYLLGGVAAGNAEGTVTAGPVGTDTQTLVGWTAGVGTEVRLADSVTGFVEYRYTDYGSKPFTIAGITTSQFYKDNAVRTGINFHF